jgi:hypothetical protein
MSQDLVTLQTFPTVEEAYAFKNLLEAGGVSAYLTDEATVGMVWHLGNALGGVKVQVAEADLDRAREVLAAETISPADLKAQATAQPFDLADECVESEDRFQISDEGDEIAPESPGDVLANRAFKAAVIGLFLCPPILHVYSLFILLRLRLSTHSVSPAVTWKQTAAFLIDAAVLGAIAYVLFQLLGAH